MDIKILATGSKGNCCYISDGSTSLLLDCGIPARLTDRLLSFRLHHISGVLMTHCHADHSKAAKEMAARGITVYSSKGTFDALKLEGYYFMTIKKMTEFNIGTFRILPFDVEHDAPEPLGFTIKSRATGETLLFFTDTYYLRYKFKNINYMLCECNYSINTIQKDLNPVLRDRIIQSHMSLETLKEFIRASDRDKLRQIYLLHLSDGNSDAALFREEIQKLTGVEVYVG